MNNNDLSIGLAMCCCGLVVGARYPICRGAPFFLFSAISPHPRCPCSTRSRRVDEIEAGAFFTPSSSCRLGSAWRWVDGYLLGACMGVGKWVLMYGRC
eukprot:scaffold40345_cov31-Phaeocystis_antarctica.AAC.2